jgi:hypothetical protein
MRTKRGGYRPEKPKQGAPRVRLKVTSPSTPRPVSPWRLAERPSEPLDAGLFRFLANARVPARFLGRA